MKRKAPITQCLLLDIVPLFERENPLQAAVCALFLVAFYLGKSNLVVDSEVLINPKILLRSDLYFDGSFAYVTVHTSRTSQFQKRILSLPLPHVPGSLLCLMSANPKLPLGIWAEAYSTAVYLHNRSPTTVLKDKTPFESLFGRRPDVSQLKVFGCVSYVQIPNDQHRKLDAEAHKAIFVGYPPWVKGYKSYDLEKKFVVSQDVQFFQYNFDHFKEGPPVDMKSIFPDMNEGIESVPGHPLKEEPAAPEQVEPPDQKNKEPMVSESVKPPAQKDVESAVPQNVEAVGAPNEEALVKRAYEDKFMEDVRNLGPVRERRDKNAVL